ncbi:MAG: geranylgeranyl reductase family protein, partial [Rhodobacterales bacterium]|nr:geranylgeranyl reductase family protein [Rhodobacterales bacterium]
MFDVVVIGGGPCGSTAANHLASLGHKTALLDRAGRIKPCGGAIPPRAIIDFEIPDELLKAKVTTARMVSPTKRSVDIPIENGYVGMVDREEFDEFLRDRAAKKGATRFTGTFEKITRDNSGTTIHFRNHENRTVEQLKTRYIIGADGARSNVAKAEIPDSDKIPYVIAYHEIIEAPEATGKYDPERCDVIYDGIISPDFYGWVFP